MSAVEKQMELQLCHDKSKPCTKCDLVYIIKDYIIPLMQLLTNDMNDFNIQMRTSKCLNTGLMLMYFMAGKKGVQIVKECDCSETNRKKPDNKISLKTLSKGLYNKNFKNRHLYYVLLTDAHIKSTTDIMTTYFPGHVFIFEKFKENGQIYFNIYQSYNKEYDLKEYIETKMKKGPDSETIKIHYNDITAIINGLKHLLTSSIWDDKCIEFWNSFTHVDSSVYKNKNIHNQIYICSKSIKVDGCVSNIQNYIHEKLKHIETIGDRYNSYIYGDSTKYIDKVKALSVIDIKNKLQELMDKITKNRDYMV